MGKGGELLKIPTRREKISAEKMSEAIAKGRTPESQTKKMRRASLPRTTAAKPPVEIESMNDGKVVLTIDTHKSNGAVTAAAAGAVPVSSESDDRLGAVLHAARFKQRRTAKGSDSSSDDDDSPTGGGGGGGSSTEEMKVEWCKL